VGRGKIVFFEIQFTKAFYYYNYT